MDRLGHQTPHENGYTMPCDFFAEHPEIPPAIHLQMKHVHEANTTLRGMVRIPGDHAARQTSHSVMLCEPSPRVNNKSLSCPLIPMSLPDSFLTSRSEGRSRPHCDLGWLGYKKPVGLTGSTVSPELYVACGVSGAVQRCVGMRGSGFVMAINSDTNAPRFTVADVCAVEDLTTFIPVPVEALRSRLGYTMEQAEDRG